MERAEAAVREAVTLPAGPRSPASAVLVSQVERLVKIALPHGEELDQVEILVRTRRGPDQRVLGYRRLSNPGSDPDVSLTMLQVFEEQVSDQISSQPK